ncbi:transketolase family protein [Aliamphritea hakodatensis]|uniref:transketolase family protein n=1 Tax=Aliamphritea hakodatensis TaxID=2895352 RepID=UPI0022FD95DC|nr:transketolase C-terminal domain-containing protein [Aliamphritea hakodatensis]
MTRATSLHLGDFTSSVSVYGNQAVPKYYGDALVQVAREIPEVMCLGCDLSASTETDVFRDAIPERFVMIGMQEANAIGVASGMARMGDIPFVHSFGVFMTRRAFDQVAMQVAYPKNNVKIVGFLPGLTTLLGVSHQAIEDISLMRSLPGMTVIEPAGAAQALAAVRAVAGYNGPVYLRMERASESLADDQPLMELEIGKAQTLCEGEDLAIFACGLMVGHALKAADILTDRFGIACSVINMHTIKPLDKQAVLQQAVQGKGIITAENHSVIGGLGSAVAEVLAEAGKENTFLRVGIQDTFAQGGSLSYLQEKYGLSVAHLVRVSADLLNKTLKEQDQ